MASRSVPQRYAERFQSLLTDPRRSLYACLPLLLFDAVLTAFIITRVPYTEIDWRAYMQQIAIYRSGERKYTKIYGDTGPLVYGAGHVYIYDLLYQLTDGGKDLRKAQWIFAGVYMVALGLVMACYRKGQVLVQPARSEDAEADESRLHRIFSPSWCCRSGSIRSLF